MAMNDLGAGTAALDASTRKGGSSDVTPPHQTEFLAPSHLPVPAEDVKVHSPTGVVETPSNFFERRGNSYRTQRKHVSVAAKGAPRDDEHDAKQHLDVNIVRLGSSSLDSESGIRNRFQGLRDNLEALPLEGPERGNDDGNNNSSMVLNTSGILLEEDHSCVDNDDSLDGGEVSDIDDDEENDECSSEYTFRTMSQCDEESGTRAQVLVPSSRVSSTIARSTSHFSTKRAKMTVSTTPMRTPLRTSMRSPQSMYTFETVTTTAQRSRIENTGTKSRGSRHDLTVYTEVSGSPHSGGYHKHWSPTKSRRDGDMTCDSSKNSHVLTPSAVYAWEYLMDSNSERYLVTQGHSQQQLPQDQTSQRNHVVIAEDSQQLWGRQNSWNSDPSVKGEQIRQQVCVGSPSNKRTHSENSIASSAKYIGSERKGASKQMKRLISEFDEKLRALQVKQKNMRMQLQTLMK